MGGKGEEEWLAIALQEAWNQGQRAEILSGRMRRTLRDAANHHTECRARGGPPIPQVKENGFSREGHALQGRVRTVSWWEVVSRHKDVMRGGDMCKYCNGAATEAEPGSSN